MEMQIKRFQLFREARVSGRGFELQFCCGGGGFGREGFCVMYVHTQGRISYNHTLPLDIYLFIYR